MAFQVEVWGDYACFTRPELKTERVSYDVMTPSAARGLIEAIYWHPGIRWVIDKIHVCSPIRFTNVRRNEVKSKASARNAKGAMEGNGRTLCISTSDDIQQRAALVLRDVRYVIEAHFELIADKMTPEDNEGKFCDIMRRRLAKGQCYHQPCFGTREFPAHFRSWRGGPIDTAYPQEDRELGLMLFDLDYSDPQNLTPIFFRAKLQRGVLVPGDCEVFR